MDSLFSVPNSLYGLNIVKRREHTGTNGKTWFLAMWSGRGPLFWQKRPKKNYRFLSPTSRFRPKHGFKGGTRGSPSIADWSLKVSRVSHHRKKFPFTETEANLGQNWQKSAVRVLWLFRPYACARVWGLIFSPFNCKFLPEMSAISAQIWKHGNILFP